MHALSAVWIAGVFPVISARVNSSNRRDNGCFWRMVSGAAAISERSSARAFLSVSVRSRGVNRAAIRKAVALSIEAEQVVDSAFCPCTAVQRSGAIHAPPQTAAGRRSGSLTASRDFRYGKSTAAASVVDESLMTTEPPIAGASPQFCSLMLPSIIDGELSSEKAAAGGGITSMMSGRVAPALSGRFPGSGLSRQKRRPVKGMFCKLRMRRARVQSPVYCVIFTRRRFQPCDSCTGARSLSSRIPRCSSRAKTHWPLSHTNAPSSEPSETTAWMASGDQT